MILLNFEKIRIENITININLGTNYFSVYIERVMG